MTATARCWRWRKSAPDEIGAAQPRARLRPQRARRAGLAAARRAAPNRARARSRPRPRSRRRRDKSRRSRTRLARGRIVHRLLQALPALPAGTPRRGRATAISRAARISSDAERDDTSSREVLARARRCTLRAVVRRKLARRGADRRRSFHRRPTQVSGQVDRLAVTESEVLIADYKSDRAVPRARRGHSAGLCRATWRSTARCLRKLYPNHAVRAALVWTAGPALMELPAAALDAALSRLASA